MFTAVIFSAHSPAPAVYVCDTLPLARTIGTPCYGEKTFIYDSKFSNIRPIDTIEYEPTVMTLTITEK